jgi:hypothetical protein
MNQLRLMRRALQLGYAALARPANNMTAQDVINIAADDGAAKLEALNAVKATPEKSGLGAFNDAQVSQERMSAAENFCPWEFYDGAD